MNAHCQPNALADRAAQPDPDRGTDDAHDLLQREGARAVVRGVVVGDQRVRRRLRDPLAEAEQRATEEQLGEGLRRRDDHRERAPRDDGVADRARAVPPVGEVARRDGDEPVHQHEDREQQTDLAVADAEVVLQLRDDAAQDVLVGLIDQDHEAEHPHRPRAHPRRRVAPARPRLAHPAPSWPCGPGRSGPARRARCSLVPIAASLTLPPRIGGAVSRTAPSRP